MLDWFEKTAPVRMKFKALLAILTVLSAIGVVTTLLAGGSPALVLAAMSAMALTMVTVSGAAQRICTPYVNTVMRMEALASGDTTSPVPYTDYHDCVGRMTKAMAIFRDTMIEVQQTRATYQNLFSSLNSGLASLAENQLTYRIVNPLPGEADSLRQCFNNALDELSSTIVSIRRSANSVDTGAAEIRAASDDLAQRNEQQAAGLEQTVAAMNQVTSIVRATANAAAEVQRAIHEAHDEATEGGEVVRKAIAAMAAIEQSAREITQIINVIDGIAFQTNLLALNAGVEAARAGDAGKGFAVVANEVRALAQRSADAAKNIKELITASTEQVGGGVTLVGETGTLLENILQRVGQISLRVSEIAQSSESQAGNLQQVNATMGKIDRMTQQNAAMVEESTAAARSLADEARQLTGLVSHFRTGEDSAVITLRPASPRSAPSNRSAPVIGNLALQAAPETNTDDWSEF